MSKEPIVINYAVGILGGIICSQSVAYLINYTKEKGYFDYIMEGSYYICSNRCSY